MWNIIAFTSLGFLIGNLVGLTSESTIVSLIGLLFVFAGSSAISFMHKLSEHEKINASKAIMSLSISCLVGVYASAVISDNQLLTFEENMSNKRDTIASRKYIRENIISEVNQIDKMKADNEISVDKAYEKLYKLIINKDN